MKSCKSVRDTPPQPRDMMWFKNLSNSLMSSFNRPTLLRLDSTGEVSSDNDYKPSIRVITNTSGTTETSTKSPIKHLNFMNGISACRGFVNLQNSSKKSGQTGLIADVSKTNLNNYNMYSDRMTANNRSWVPNWPNPRRSPYFSVSNNGQLGYQNNLGYYSKPNVYIPSHNKFTHKLDPDSPWLQVNSGYSQYDGSNDYFCRTPIIPNIKCAFNKKCNHKTNSRHKKCPEEKRNISENTRTVSDSRKVSETLSEFKSCISSVNDETPSASVDICDRMLGNSSVCDKKTEVCQLNIQHGYDNKKEEESMKDQLQIEKCESKNIDNVVQYSQAKAGETQPCISTESVEHNKLESNRQHIGRISKFHLSIISKKNSNNKQLPKNGETPSSSEDKNVDSDKSAQKNCTICTAYITRVIPECKDFPKSAGCKHSIILVVRDNTKKTKKRRTKEKYEKVHHTGQSPPKSFTFGVNSSDYPDGSPVLKFFESGASDTDDSWDSDYDEVDGYANNWSNIEMEGLFPGKHSLLNPMNFKVHISSAPVTVADCSTTACPSSPSDNHIKTINLSWNIRISSEINGSTCSTKPKNNKKVRFESDKKLTVVHPIIAWSYAYQASRKGPWEEYARDRERFSRRIQEVEKVLVQVLSENHRSHIYNSLYFNNL